MFNKISNILINYEKPSIEIEKLFNKEDFKKSSFNIISELEKIPQEKKFHPEGNVWNHTKMVVDVAAKINSFSSNAQIFMWAALLHDIGKITTTKFIKGRYRSYDHDKEGANITYRLLELYENMDFTKRVTEIVRFHMHHIYIIKKLPFSDIEGLLNSENFNDIILLFICDKLGRGNQNLSENKNNINEVYTILDILDKKSNKNFEDLRNLINKIEFDILNLK
ncbi:MULTISPECIES: HD domain-containing protein [Clostridium]|uniref:Multifunctional CCA protein n=2 Tax=root TaxID=1 RepID=A0A644WCP6_9ZZZZ|nr:HD domain-containing protein [Clostridium sp. C8]KLE14323.1 hypothetical protein AAT22_17330 [Clostridium sp. C8]